MAIKKIRMRPEGVNDYEDVLHPETSAEQVKLTSSNFVAKDVKTGMDELFTNVSNGKQLVSSAITDKGVITNAEDTFRIMANNIASIQTKSILSGNAVASQVLSGKTFYNDSETKQTGTMPNHGAPTQTLTTQGGQYKIPAGYFSGGSVKAQFANLSAGNIKSGVTVGGVKGNLFPSIDYRSVAFLAAQRTAKITFSFIPIFLVVKDYDTNDQMVVISANSSSPLRVNSRTVVTKFSVSGTTLTFTYELSGPTNEGIAVVAVG